MQYFTPERYLRLGNLDNETEFLSAQQDWEEALSAYRDHLNAIKPKLPPTLRRFIGSVYLHGARVLSMYQNEELFVITLEPSSDPSRLVVLLYTLVKEPRVTTGRLPPDRCREPIEWLYDEFDLDQPEGPCGLPRPAGNPTFRHTILLSNGWEVALRFRRIGISRPLRVIPVLPENTARERSA
jgi:hypothetical protein